MCWRGCILLSKLMPCSVCYIIVITAPIVVSNHCFADVVPLMPLGLGHLLAGLFPRTSHAKQSSNILCCMRTSVCQKQVSVGCNYLSLRFIPASGTLVHVFLRTQSTKKRLANDIMSDMSTTQITSPKSIGTYGTETCHNLKKCMQI